MCRRDSVKVKSDQVRVQPVSRINFLTKILTEVRLLRRLRFLRTYFFFREVFEGFRELFSKSSLNISQMQSLDFQFFRVIFNLTGYDLIKKRI